MSTRANIYRTIPTALVLICLAVCPLGGVRVATAQTDEAVAAQEPAVTVNVEERRKSIEQRLALLDSAALPEGDLRKATEFFQQALTALTEYEQQRAHQEKLAKDIDTYPKSLEDAKRDLASLTGEPAAIDASAAVDALESLQNELQATVQSTRELLTKSESLPKTRSARLTELPKLTLELQQQLAETTSRLEKLPAAESTDLVLAAEGAALEARRDSLTQQLATMETQRRYYLMSSELVQLRRDYRAKLLARSEKSLADVKSLVQRRRKQDAEQQAAEAAEAAEVQRPEAIAALAESNAKLAQEQAEVVASIEQVEQQLAEASTQLETIETQFARSQERIDASGMTESIGVRLRQQQEQLPSVRQLRREIAQLGRQKSTVTYKLYDLHDTRSEVVDAELDQRVDELLAKLPADDREASADEVRELFTTEREILDSTIDAYESYSNQLTALTAVQTNLVAQTTKFANYITKNVLWIRSCNVPSLSDVQPAVGALRWSLNPRLWRDSLVSLWEQMQKKPLLGIAFLVVMSALVYVQERFRRRLRDIGLQTEKRTCTDFSLSVHAAVITFALALPWPAMVWFAGWWLSGDQNQSEFTHTLSRGLQFTSVCLLLLELVRHVCRTKGLAESHFSWPKACVSQVRRNTRAIYSLALPLVFWLVGLENQHEQRLWSSSLGRLLFVVVMGLVTVALWRVLVTKSSAIRQSLLQHSQQTSLRAATLWMPTVVAIPVLLAGLALVGYYYTAQQLALRMLGMVALVWLLIVLGSLTRRWILLNRRRLAREQARQKRAAAAAAAEANGESPPPAISEIPEEAVDLHALGEQTNRLVQTLLVVIGLVSAWLIWREMLPALSLVGEQSIPGFQLKWEELLRFGLVLAVTYVAVKNIPALLEFTVLQHLPLDTGLRYAITSLCRYVLVAIGIYLAYTALGFDSTSIQWLVAAMGVGLGFGLQEIFANFVSGVILLFERPIRVGDIVTLGEKTGQVSRIRMRATTIVDWDRKEYVVPNKDLVTERLLNWTLSDQTNRIVVLVGVAYGSDTNQACQLLLEAAREHPLILEDPAPSAVFSEFGDSTLNLTLRCYLPNLDKRLDTIHDLHTAIDRKFKDAEIEIAFPQLDLHVKEAPQPSIV